MIFEGTKKSIFFGLGLTRAGSNMPDISLLAELADFYDVSIPEIIDGERKSENMNEEVKETVLKLSDYTETINQKIKGRLFVLTVIAIIGMIVFVIIEFTGLDTPGSVYESYDTIKAKMNSVLTDFGYMSLEVYEDAFSEEKQLEDLLKFKAEYLASK